MTNEGLNWRTLGIAVFVLILLLVVILAVRSISQGEFGTTSASPYPVFEGVYPPPHTEPDPGGHLTATAEEVELRSKIPTREPAPTLIPTPQVTPVPVAKLPLLPPLDCPPDSPGRIIFRQGNALMALDEGNRKAETLVDVQESLGQYLAGDGVGGHNTEWISVSPDGEQIALVLTTDPGPWERGEPLIELGIYLYDRKSGKVGLIMEHATQPAWSPEEGVLLIVQAEICG